MTSNYPQKPCQQGHRGIILGDVTFLRRLPRPVLVRHHSAPQGVVFDT